MTRSTAARIWALIRRFISWAFALVTWPPGNWAARLLKPAVRPAGGAPKSASSGARRSFVEEALPVTEL